MMKITLKTSLVSIGIGLASLLLFGLSEMVPLSSDSLSIAFAQDTTSGIEQVILRVEGMTCRSCVKPLRKALQRIPGVKKAKVSYSAAQAVVECERGKVTDEQLVKAIENQSSFFYTYTASVTSRN